MNDATAAFPDPQPPTLRAGFRRAYRAMLCLLATAAPFDSVRAEPDTPPNNAMAPFQDAAFREAFQEARRRGLPPDGMLLVVCVASQRLVLGNADGRIQVYPVSTSRHGIGNRENSFQTPPGWHRVAQRFGAGRPLGQVFQTRRSTHRILPPTEFRSESTADYILTRILWLEGLEPGRNRGPGIDSFLRTIYLHGTHQEHRLGTPASKGCIRMANHAILELFDRTANRETWCRIDP